METPQLGPANPSGKWLSWQGIFFPFLQRNTTVLFQLQVSAREADVSQNQTVQRGKKVEITETWM